MKLKVSIPTEILVEAQVEKVIAEAENGSFCLLPKHIDFVAALVPGLLSYHTANGAEHFLAVDEGLLVKTGDEVLVTVRSAVRGPHLGRLQQAVRDQFEKLDEQERRARSLLVKLEMGIMRQLAHFK